MEDKFILTTKDSFESDKKWILDNTCLEWEGFQTPTFSGLKSVFYGFRINNNVVEWNTSVDDYFQDLTPVMVNDKTKQELKEKYPKKKLKTWIINGKWRTQAEIIDDAIKQYTGDDKIISAVEDDGQEFIDIFAALPRMPYFYNPMNPWFIK